MDENKAAAADDAQVQAKRRVFHTMTSKCMGEYSLRIHIPFGHVHMEGHDYDEGNDVVIFRMQPQDIINMGHAILTAGITLTGEA